ncbi:Mur ligase domain-containing protein [Kitasatospora sp. NPDC047058]|uniref:Mur ligase domain-containing protein n=1 Tax=Kitasatospora sp. NPDC047058 TaxID=3155620 RepID=UPI0033CB3608
MATPTRTEAPAIAEVPISTVTEVAAEPAVPAVPELLSAPHLTDVTHPGTAGLALWLAARGADVTGSADPSPGDEELVGQLTAAGVRVRVGSDAGHVGADRSAVVWSGVALGPHPELDRAQQLGLPVVARAHALAEVCAGAGRPTVAVAGSHSTATAAAVLARALDDGETGWILTAPAAGVAAGHSGRRRLVVDLCPDTATHEAAPPGAWQPRLAARSPFRSPSPSVVLITAADASAPHYEDTIAGLDAATSLARSATTVVLPTWENSVKIVAERLRDRPGPQVVTVGLDESADVWVMVPRWMGDCYHLTLRYKGEQHPFVVRLAGRHHALAAGAAIATALVAGENAADIAERLTAFEGVRHSLTDLGTRGFGTVVESRARHPREVAQDVTAARMLTEGSVIAVLEPDGVARATAHAAELGKALGEADLAVLLPVSTPLPVVHADDPLEAIAAAAAGALGGSGAVHRVRTGPCEPSAEQVIRDLGGPDDLVLLIGTGRAALLGPRLLAQPGRPAADN